MRAFIFCAAMLILSCNFAGAQIVDKPDKPMGIALEELSYPHPVHFLNFKFRGEDARMAYMDVKPSGNSSGRVVLLFHGKNFFGEYWSNTIAVLANAGYRVVVPDQIGFGKSSKPDIHYSFHEMAAQTKELLEQLGISRVAVVGHSMGGMLATRFALLYPESVTELTLEDPIGLEDYREKVPFLELQRVYAGNLKATEESIRNYFKTYFVTWKPEYEKYVQAQCRQTLSGEYPRLAWSSALTEEMIYEQPVCHEFQLLKPKTLLIIGQSDRTTIGRNRVSAEVLKTLGQYPELGRKTAKIIPNGRLVEVPQVGHIPHLEAPEIFHRELLKFLSE
ncbi:MAG: 2-hydroxy-6-oxo-6-phenylhexa-2,4-dienoate hydrolase [Pedosphaera sp.]|nr:2-hydroxy-6-oxo-6-phenylhexa-2,4-dienoate hydrolase [Pedosphaera sp.]